MAAVLRTLAVHPDSAAALVPMQAELRLDLAEPPVFRGPWGAAGGHWLDVLPEEAPALFMRTDPIFTKEERARVTAAMQAQGQPSGAGGGGGAAGRRQWRVPCPGR